MPADAKVEEGKEPEENDVQDIYCPMCHVRIKLSADLTDWRIEAILTSEGYVDTFRWKRGSGGRRPEDIARDPAGIETCKGCKTLGRIYTSFNESDRERKHPRAKYCRKCRSPVIQSSYE